MTINVKLIEGFSVRKVGRRQQQQQQNHADNQAHVFVVMTPCNNNYWEFEAINEVIRVETVEGGKNTSTHLGQ